MDPNRKSAKEIFMQAVEKAPSDRDAYLDEACRGDHALRQRVEALLRANDAPGAFLSSPQNDINETVARPTAQPLVGTIIAGRYKLLEQIGDGGMGTVWMAEQRAPIKRLVAIKLIKPGMDSNAVLGRFEAERQALALMDHPNIAKVLDGGTTAEGRPYFVMELVKGLPLTEYCDARRLSLKERLSLFIDVCAAVQHAHQKGVIHRDLKPTNVLVTEHDGKPIPKVIDFGLAKALNATNMLTDRTLHTAYGTVVGTPLYMAPEQVGINALDVDTRTDIYSLGVVLYELLAGSTPLETKRVKQAAWDEVKRLIREEDPPRPSTRLSTSISLPGIAASRGAEPAQLSRLVKGELDWIAMKALEKDRGRRYETANGLAMDVRRYLSGEPVLAVPPSRRYRLRKFIVRNSAAMSAAAAIILLLVGGVTVSSWLAVRAHHAAIQARDAQNAEALRAQGERQAKLESEARRIDVEHQKARAEAGEKKAEEEKQAAEAVLNFLEDRLLSQADALTQADTLLQSGGRSSDVRMNPTIRELLDRAAVELAPDKIDAAFPNQQLVQADILQAIGNAYRGIGQDTKAIQFLQRALELARQKLGPDEPRTLVIMNNLVVAYDGANLPALALPLAEETARNMKQKLGTKDRRTLVALSNVSSAELDVGRVDAAFQHSEEVYRLMQVNLGENDELTLQAGRNLAVCYQKTGRNELALPLITDIVKRQNQRLGPLHPATFYSNQLLATILIHTGKQQAGLLLLKECADLFEIKLGDQHPLTLGSRMILAREYGAAGKFEDAIPLMEQTLQIEKEKLGPDNPLTIDGMEVLANLYNHSGKSDEGTRLMNDALAIRKNAVGVQNRDTLLAMNNLGVAYQKSGKSDLAVPLLDQVLNLATANLGFDDSVTSAARINLASTYQQMAKPQLAVAMHAQALKQMTAKYGAEDSHTRLVANNLAEAYLAAAVQHAWFGRHAEFTDTIQQALAFAKDTTDPINAERIAKACIAFPTSDQSILTAGLELAQRAVKLGQKHPYLPYFKTTLGIAFYRNGHFAQAEAALSDAAKGTPNTRLIAIANCYRAMSLCQLGQVDAARPLAADAASKTQPPATTDKLVPFHDELILEMASKEAATLLNAASAPATAPVSPASSAHN